jgi:hypothetical protein
MPSRLAGAYAGKHLYERGGRLGARERQKDIRRAIEFPTVQWCRTQAKALKRLNRLENRVALTARRLDTLAEQLSFNESH